MPEQELSFPDAPRIALDFRLAEVIEAAKQVLAIEGSPSQRPLSRGPLHLVPLMGRRGVASGAAGVVNVQRKYEDDLIWTAMREAGLSVDDVTVRDICALIDDERPHPSDGTFRVTLEWNAPHDVCLRILQRARELEAENPRPPEQGDLDDGRPDD